MVMAFHRWLLRASDRVYQYLLMLYPAGFRHAYKAQMAQLFRDCCRDALQRGGIARVTVLWLTAFADLAINVPGEQVLTMLQNIEQQDVIHAQRFGTREEAVFLISAQQIPDAKLLHLMECPCVTRRIGSPLAF